MQELACFANDFFNRSSIHTSYQKLLLVMIPRNLTASFIVFLTLLDGACSAAVISLNFSVPLSSAENTGDGHNQILQFQVPSSVFSVGNGQTVRSNLMFLNGESFTLIFDSESPAVGTQGYIEFADGGISVNSAEFGFEFGFLDKNGNVLLAENSARVTRAGGSLHGDVTILQSQTIEVGGLFFEFNNIVYTNLTVSTASFNGVRYEITNALLGEPFSNGNTNIVPEPASSTIAGFSFLISLLAIRKRSRNIP
jgi:hypothetical protein